MMKFMIQSPAGPIYGLGLSDEDVRDLKEGRAIPVDLADVGGPPITIGLCYTGGGRDPLRDFEGAGLIVSEPLPPPGEDRGDG